MNGMMILALAPVVAALELPVGLSEKAGIVTVLMIAVVAIWREGLRRQDRLEAIIERNSVALGKTANAILECHNRMARPAGKVEP
jgi:hypothetical protein